MKKHYLAALLATGLVTTSFLAPLAQADTILGVYAGVEGWRSETTGNFSEGNGTSESFNFEDESLTNFYVALEHPIPLVPNVKIKHNEIEVNGTTTLTSGFEFGDTVYQVGSKANAVSDLSHNDFVFYYEIFDNSLVSIDLGFNIKQFDGSIAVTGTDGTNTISEKENFSGYVPLGYAALEAGLPFTGLSVFFEGSLLAIDDSKIQDYQVGVAWEVIDNMAVDVAIKLGYRSLLLELDDVDDITTDLEVEGPFLGVQVHF
ncbi:TIGR04219 family outer membrane beta-barrel protein [Pseudoalteromonas denitrificans]|uniref:Outer membrane protein n=1 Tax=Pseudoalteromonas denitrificans DSM 6059 TaxID=1123010 RepID=A0A1I1PIY7_9GAMM|nr:TIGR04219 family outer membrane beta-barrel protein [Pseudoalteromonas denitrificans]SFD07638.1 outer membrane protein [Pseudoalteromonas denitrificans DSM 6059]